MINLEHQFDRRSVNRRSNLIWLATEKPDLRCHLAGTHLWGPRNPLCQMGVHDPLWTPKVKGRHWGQTPDQNMQLQITAVTW